MSWYTKWTEEVNAKKTKKDSKKSASSYWYDDYDRSFDYLETYGNWGKTTIADYKKTHNLYKLASVRRAIANFVQIVTQKNIPVTFATKSESKTDGKKVILSADVDDKFDVSVGLALHEGSHIVLSDFELLKHMNDMYDRYKYLLMNVYSENKRCMERGDVLTFPNKESYDKDVDIIFLKYPSQYHKFFRDIYHSTGKIGCYGDITPEIFNTISGLTNWIEDRRIDNYIFKSAPGYRDYYTTMYDHYFNDKLVTKGIASDEYTSETIESYMFRIINLMNENTSLSKLKGLRSIYRKLDLKNIDRLQSSQDSLELAIDVVSEILKCIPIGDSNMTPAGNGEDDNQNGQPNGMQGDVNETADGESDEMGGMNGSADVNGEASSQQTKSDDGDTKDQLSKTAKEQLTKKFQKQKDFLNGELKKKTISTAEAKKLESIDESGTELVRVGSEYAGRGGRINKGVDCVVVKKLTDKIMDEDDFPFSSGWQGAWAESEVKRGLTLGTILGKKLQIRGESRETVFSRLKKGKIDARMIASLGYDNENVFYTNEIDQYKKANLHISVDYSGSMQGEKLRKAIVATVAIVKACSMARNVNTQVSIRSTDTSGRALPYIVMVHDSRKNTLKQFAKYMSRLKCSNTTPEGLCFEAIQKQLIPTDNNVDSYFLNMSDGQPYYSISQTNDQIDYSGHSAAEHTNAQVKKMMGNGINVLSYFITEYSKNFESTEDWQIFKKCYGKDAHFVDTENVFQIAKTMNELFLKKS
jgi:hypothetical protein